MNERIDRYDVRLFLAPFGGEAEGPQSSNFNIVYESMRGPVARTSHDIFRTEEE